MISPEDVPIPPVDCDAVEKAGEKLKGDGDDVSQAGQDIKSSWQGLQGIYSAPEQETLFAAIDPVATKGDDFDGAVTSVGTALINFANDVRPIKRRLQTLKADAESFQSKISGDEDWREDEDKINELDSLNNDILQAVFEYQRAERECANTITALFGGTTFVATEPGEQGSLGANQVAHGTSEALKDIETPWVTPQEHDAPWWEDVGNGIKDFGVGIAEDLGALVGLYGEDGWGVSSWSEWGSNLKNNWGDTLNGLGSLVGFYGKDGWGVSSFGEWWGNFSSGWTEFAHAVVPWREWGDRPGYVITQSVLNIGSMALGGAGVVKALAKSSRKIGGGDVDTNTDAPNTDIDAPQLQQIGNRPGQQSTQDLQNQLDDMSLDQDQLQGLQNSLDQSEGLDTHPSPVGGGDPIDVGDNRPGGGGGRSDGDTASGDPVDTDPAFHEGDGNQHGGDAPSGDAHGIPDPDGAPTPEADGTPPGEGHTPDTGSSDGPANGPDVPDDPADPVDLDELTTTERMARAESLISDGARTFPDNDAATRYGQDYWNDYVENLPPEQRKSLFNYSTEPPQNHPTYVEMNGQLRRGETLDPEVRRDIENIDQAMQGRPVPEDIVVTRGTGLGHIDVSPEKMPDVEEGFPDPGYMSTSLGSAAGAFKDAEAILHLRVPAGTPALWMEKASDFGAGERELLLGRGATYRVADVVWSGGQWHVYGEVMAK
ncbi:ADP-ribosyltransferase [Streptomonospora sp. PA3]|uniref:ADP-ribosyltransferase n=1 Tax=Streptomonospora sp. PA3 TaxID=2607326 RepID=UPI0012DC29F9